MKNFISMFNLRLIILIILLFSMLVSVPVVAQTSLWKISKGDKHLYLGGTVHVLSADDYPLPKEFEEAFLASDMVVFEADIAKAKGSEFSRKMMQQLLYPLGTSLQDVLNKETYQRLADYFSNKVPMGQIDAMKPGMVVIMLSAIEFQRMGMVLMGVDEHFWNLAQQAGKPVDTLETLDEQLSFLVNMGEGYENELILNTLNELNQVDSMIHSLKTAWRSGNELDMKNIVLQDMVDDYPELYQSILVTRNNKWLPRIEALLEKREAALVLVGALHLVGDDGLLQLLRNKGYDVEHY